MLRALTVALFSMIACQAATARQGGPISQFDEMIGQWDQVGRGDVMIISPEGRVFTDRTGFLSGSVDDDPGFGGNFAFSQHNSKCSYRVSFLDSGEMDFRVVGATPGTLCPGGIFTKSH